MTGLPTWHRAHRGNGFRQLEQLVMQGRPAVAELRFSADRLAPFLDVEEEPLGAIEGDAVTAFEQKLQIK